MDDRERLYALCKEHGVEVHHKSGVAKLQQALMDAGIEFELVDTESDRGPDPDLEIPHPGAPKGELEGYGAPAPEEAPPAAPKSQSDMVEVMVMVRSVHIQPKDMGKPDTGVSEKMKFKDRFEMKRSVALSIGDKVEIL
tara:strand:+ start:7811 stop:8227 length:417 start_codon:yes stop_codon:yes gene_type:complete